MDDNASEPNVRQHHHLRDAVYLHSVAQMLNRKLHEHLQLDLVDEKRNMESANNNESNLIIVMYFSCRSLAL